MSSTKPKPRTKRWWIKERYNPQLGTYWVPCGQLSKAEAKRKENTLYGDNTMHSFETEKEYRDRIDSLRAEGEKLNEVGA